MKAGIYTRTGDKGQTSLAGQRVLKSHYRIDAIGAVDELNSVLGMIVTYCEWSNCCKLYKSIQADLFTVGAILSGCEEIAVDQGRIAQLEEKVDEISAELKPLRNFILPGGDPESGWCHLARTTCRRAERAIVNVQELDANVPENILVYMNRLSDLFFVLARKANKNGEHDIVWTKPSPLHDVDAKK